MASRVDPARNYIKLAKEEAERSVTRVRVAVYAWLVDVCPVE